MCRVKLCLFTKAFGVVAFVCERFSKNWEHFTSLFRDTPLVPKALYLVVHISLRSTQSSSKALTLLKSKYLELDNL